VHMILVDFLWRDLLLFFVEPDGFRLAFDFIFFFLKLFLEWFRDVPGIFLFSYFLEHVLKYIFLEPGYIWEKTCIQK
jgi:hypothetical protein